jgi:23S rRNA (uracil1939-C5)-methyltransferase
VNTAVAARMVEYVLGLLPDSEIDTLIDLYCGVGLFSKFMAPKVNELIGIELSESACEDYAANLVDFNHVSLYQGAAEEVLPYLDVHPQVVLADPPRAGLADAVLSALLKMRPEKLIYISCDPSTLAQDLARLVDNGYSLNMVQPFDLFPQTFHVECIVLLSNKKPDEH